MRCASIKVKLYALSQKVHLWIYHQPEKLQIFQGHRNKVQSWCYLTLILLSSECENRLLKSRLNLKCPFIWMSFSLRQREKCSMQSSIFQEINRFNSSLLEGGKSLLSSFLAPERFPCKSNSDWEKSNFSKKLDMRHSTYPKVLWRE